MARVLLVPRGDVAGYSLIYGSPGVALGRGELGVDHGVLDVGLPEPAPHDGDVGVEQERWPTPPVHSGRLRSFHPGVPGSAALATSVSRLCWS